MLIKTRCWIRGALYFIIVGSVLLAILVLIAQSLDVSSAAPLVGVAMFTPAVAAVVVRLARGEGFDDAGLSIGPIKWYAYAWVISVLLVALDFLWLWIFNLAEFSPSAERLAKLNQFAEVQDFDEAIPGFSGAQTIALMAIASLTVANIPMVVAGLGEELGWRGYLLPRLLHFGVWPAFILVGIVWWFWHLPLNLLNPSTIELNPLILYPAGLVAAILFGAILAWLRYSSTSIFVAALAHITYNNASGAGHLFFDVDFNAIAVVRAIDVGIFCMVLTAMGSWTIIKDDTTKS